VVGVKPDGALTKDYRMVVSFTEGQSARVRWMRKHLGLDRPGLLVGSPRHPRYPLIYLEHLAGHIPSYHGLVKGTGWDEEKNVVLVETEQVKKVRALLRHRYGRAAPIHVEFGGGLETSEG
jgi:hypothetical protein